ncbi:hypothetical protein OC846_003679 [Tilletia horrida]|uniref:Uncharacterized protein n=1 Tax=Tilletia horrida TaxID=155126 RepID=A0AAN6JRU8_9BASI|nr:hypothetical protein OC846_003679 [Tilletia horrida]KAK0565552.1 hypothetical protein OC861_003714 [Tilletia horrida]
MNAATPDGSESGSTQRRTSWREWGTSFSSWASTSSPFRNSARPSSSSSNTTSTFSFGPTSLAKSRADVVNLPRSELTQRLIEADSEPVLMEGERLRLPPTPAELEALEEAGVQDEEDLRLEREERERIRSMPPPPRHPSVFSRFSHRASGRFTPRSSPLLEQEKETLPPLPLKETTSAGHTEQVVSDPLASPISLPPVPLDEDVTPRRTEFSRLADLPDPPVTARSDLSEVNLSSPPPAPVIPSVMISSATSQSLAGQIGLGSSLEQNGQPLEDNRASERNKDQISDQAVEQPRILDLGREDPVVTEAEVQGGGLESESEAESVKEDLIPSDLYEDSEVEDEDDAFTNQLSSGADLPETQGKRQSRGPQDRFSLLLSNLARPITEKEEHDDDNAPTTSSAAELATHTEAQTTSHHAQSESTPVDATSNAEDPVPSNASSTSEYAASSASSYQGTDEEEADVENESTDGAQDTTVILDPEASQYRSMSVEDSSSREACDLEPATTADDGDHNDSSGSNWPKTSQLSPEQQGSHTPKSSSLPEPSTSADSLSLNESTSSTSHGEATDVNILSLSEELSAVTRLEQPKTSEDTSRSLDEDHSEEHSFAEAAEEKSASIDTSSMDNGTSESRTTSPMIGATEATEARDEAQQQDVELKVGSPGKAAVEASQIGLPESATIQSFVSFSQSLSEFDEALPEDGHDEQVSKDAPIPERSASQPGSPKAEDASASDEVDESKVIDIDEDVRVDQNDEPKPEVAALQRSDDADAAEEQTSHDRLRDVLGLSRPESPAQSLRSTSSFASALSEEDRNASTDHEGTSESAENAAEGLDAAVSKQLASDTQLQLPTIEPSLLVTDDAEVRTPTVEETAVLGSPMKQIDDTVPETEGVAAESASEDQKENPDTATDENTPTPSQGEFITTNAVKEGESVTSGPNTPMVDAQSPLPTLSPNPTRPARNRNRGRKGAAPTPPSAPTVNKADEEATPTTTADEATDPTNTAEAPNGEAPTVSEPSPGAEQSAGAPSTPAVAPPSRPPRGRPPRAKGHVPALSKESIILPTSEPSTPDPEGQFATYPDAETADSSSMVSSPPTPLTPGGSKKKIQRKAVPRVQ